MSSIKDQLNSNLKEFFVLSSSPLRRDSPQYQEQLTSLLQKFIALQNTIVHNAIFSSNEGIEDLNTSEIKYLGVNCYIAQLYNELIEPSKAHNLKKTIIAYLLFLTNLNNYDILTKRQSEQLDAFKEDPFTINPEINASPQMRREEKIANYKLEKALSVQIDKLNKLEESSAELNTMDEDTVRDLYLSQLQFYALQAVNNLRIIQQELEILSNIPQPKIEQLKDQENKDGRTPTPSALHPQFTDKLETLPSSALLSKQGKILKPFTIVKRADLQSKVFGTGQYLPTITVEDYLEQELANGGMVSQSQPEESEDEDDHAVNDKETYKKREWDEFTETHRKGSGNTMNLG